MRQTEPLEEVWGPCDRPRRPRGCPQMLTAEERANTMAHLQAVLQELASQTSASRVTLRLDAPRCGLDVDGVAVEILAPGIPALRPDRSLNQRQLATVRHLETHRQILVQTNCRTDAVAPPPELIERYGVQAQMLAPLIWQDTVFGWISIHYNEGPRTWTPQDVRLLEAATASVWSLVDQRGWIGS